MPQLTQRRKGAKGIFVTALFVALGMVTAHAAPRPTAVKKPERKPPKARPVTPKEEVITPADPAAAISNSLGMMFQPVGEIQVCIWPTRVKDFEAFLKTAYPDKASEEIWKKPAFEQTPEHPVVNVTWTQATQFCEWLTQAERAAGSLPEDKEYRLLTDAEWSKAACLPTENGDSPEARDLGNETHYPWGKEWPPPQGAGNFSGLETESEMAIPDYNDGFKYTSPVGSFTPNVRGLYDMGGNVWQWVRDAWSPDSQNRALRGSSWYNGGLIRMSLLSSARIQSSAEKTADTYGFRVVIAKVAKSKK
jgi:eukaryotic-like serine/threonine-protein kinase